MEGEKHLDLMKQNLFLQNDLEKKLAVKTVTISIVLD
jgi:hypothetical protein